MPQPFTLPRTGVVLVRRQEMPAESQRRRARTLSTALMSLGVNKWRSYGRLTWSIGFGFLRLVLVR